MQDWPKKLFLANALIACFTCYARPDYNLPLFAFAYLLWDIERPVMIYFIKDFTKGAVDVFVRILVDHRLRVAGVLGSFLEFVDL